MMAIGWQCTVVEVALAGQTLMETVKTWQPIMSTIERIMRLVNLAIVRERGFGIISSNIRAWKHCTSEACMKRERERERVLTGKLTNILDYAK